MKAFAIIGLSALALAAGFQVSQAQAPSLTITSRVSPAESTTTAPTL